MHIPRLAIRFLSALLPQRRRAALLRSETVRRLAWIPLLLLALPALAAETAHRSGKLANGLTYHIFKIPSAGRQLVTRLHVGVGAADENRGEEGIAHITEHLLFQSSAQYPDGLSAKLNRSGWQMGRHYNAFTSYRHTRYLLTPPQGSRQLDEVLQIYRHILSPQQFSENDWSKEKQVVLAEWRQQQGLAARLDRRRHELVYEGARQARYAPVGRREAIENAQAATASAFHGKWYAANNAVLVLAGNLDPEDTAKTLEAQLGRLKTAALPERNPDEYTPKLQSGWRSGQIQDAENADGKTALIYRVRKIQTASDSEAAYQRLLDNFAAYIIGLRVHDSGEDVSFRTEPLGQSAAAYGFYTDSAPGRQKEALDILRNLRQEILDTPATDEETAVYRKAVHGSLQPEPEGDFPDNLAKTVRLADDSLSEGLPLPDNAAKAVERSQLYRIGAKAVNARIAEWLNAPDKTVLVQSVAGEKIELPPLSALDGDVTPDAGAIAAAPEFAEPAGGTVVSERYDPKLDLRYLKLGNGDTAVVLKTPLAGANVYFKAVSGTGFLEKPADSWKTLLAADTAARSAPAGMQANQFKRWRRQERIKYGYRIAAYSQTTDAQAPQAALPSLFKLYRSYQTAADFGGWQQAVDRETARFTVSLHSKNSRLKHLAEQMQYGRTVSMPSEENAYRSISRAALEQRWQVLTAAPVHYYIVSNQPMEDIKRQVGKYLASIPRNSGQLPTAYPQQGGSQLQRAAINDTEGAEIRAKSWYDAAALPPEILEQIPLVENLANARLKDELRSHRQSTYGVRFSITPDFDQKELESSLTFNTAADAASESWNTARRVLKNLPDTIGYQEARNLRRLFVEQENARRRKPELWLERLAASHRYYGDARYLTAVADIPDRITRSSLRNTAAMVWSDKNEQVLLLTPKK